MLNNYRTDVVALRKFMVEKKLNKIGELSKATKVDRNTLGAILSEKVQPSSRVMERLVDVLDIPPEIAGEIFFMCDLHIT